MILKDLGCNDKIEQFLVDNNLNDFMLGRVALVHKDRYVVKTEQGEFDAEITGNLRYSATSKSDFPAVGDWVLLIDYDADIKIIHQVLPRFSTLSRQAVGQYAEEQIIAANIENAFLVQAVDRDFNLSRLERYLTICNSSNVKPIVVLTKTDLIDEDRLNEIVNHVNERIPNVPVYAVSNNTQAGYALLLQTIKRGETYCLLGSSGVGKSTLTNNLLGNTVMKTDAISDSTNKGRHITSHRELFVLPEGGIVIDNPGMREVGVMASDDGLESTFDSINRIAESCKYSDCTHSNEAGCAVLLAVENDEIDAGIYENYMKIMREKQHYDLSVYEKRKKQKDFGKMVKGIKNDLQILSDKHKTSYKK